VCIALGSYNQYTLLDLALIRINSLTSLQMVSHMKRDPGPRYGVIMTDKTIQKISQEWVKNTCCQMYTNVPKMLVGIAWDGQSIHVQAAGTGVDKFKMYMDYYKRASLSALNLERESDRVIVESTGSSEEFEWKKSSISGAYSAIESFSKWFEDSGQEGPCPIVDVITAVRKMAARGVPFKSLNHTMDTTDIHIDGMKWAMTPMAQMIGRIFGLSKRVPGVPSITKRVWATPAMHRLIDDAGKAFSLMRHMIVQGNMSTSILELNCAAATNLRGHLDDGTEMSDIYLKEWAKIFFSSKKAPMISTGGINTVFKRSRDMHHESIIDTLQNSNEERRANNEAEIRITDATGHLAPLHLVLSDAPVDPLPADADPRPVPPKRQRIGKYPSYLKKYAEETDALQDHLRGILEDGPMLKKDLGNSMESVLSASGDEGERLSAVESVKLLEHVVKAAPQFDWCYDYSIQTPESEFYWTGGPGKPYKFGLRTVAAAAAAAAPLPSSRGNQIQSKKTKVTKIDFMCTELYKSFGMGDFTRQQAEAVCVSAGLKFHEKSMTKPRDEYGANGKKVHSYGGVKKGPPLVRVQDGIFKLRVAPVQQSV